MNAVVIKLLQFFGEGSLELHSMDINSFVFSFQKINELVEDLKCFEKCWESSELGPSQELYPKTIKKIIGRIERETSPELDPNEAMFFNSKSCCIKTKPNEIKSEHEGVQDQNLYTLQAYRY